MSRKTASSHRWKRRRDKDPYAGRALREGCRSRAAFKLEEIDRHERLLERGAVVVDLGAAPGGWSQLASRAVGRRGRVLAVDVLPMEPIEGVELVLGDFTDPAVAADLRARLGGRADLVMSDMAPNISGQKAIDQPRSIALAEEALWFAREVLRPGGDFLVKLFQGEGCDAFVEQTRAHFRRHRLIKPKASRAESPEIYLLARTSGL
jgi:23S rRNA (uridine2552-2'-O)-methyltransferase